MKTKMLQFGSQAELCFFINGSAACRNGKMLDRHLRL